MKISIIILLTSLAVGQFSWSASGFELVREGVVYTCLPNQQKPSNPEMTAKCARELKHRFSDEIVAKICSRAPSMEPVKCATDLKHRFPDELVGQICSGAESKERAKCATDLKHRFSDQIIADICETALTSKTAKCATDLKHRFPDEQIAELCR